MAHGILLASLVVLVTMVVYTESYVADCDRYCGPMSTFRKGHCDECCIDEGYATGECGGFPRNCHCEGKAKKKGGKGKGKGKKPAKKVVEEEEEPAEEEAPAEEEPAAEEPAADEEEAPAGKPAASGRRRG